MNSIDRTSAKSFWKYSNEYFQAALFVQPRPQSPAESLRQRVSIPAYFLVGHAIELSLKSFLRKRGVPVEELRSRKYGHDLEALVLEAKRRKLGTVVKLEPAEMKVIGLLNRTYKIKELEYLVVGSKNLPSYEALLDLTEKFVMSLRSFSLPREPNDALQSIERKTRSG
jgi:hypothetical protein